MSKQSLATAANDSAAFDPRQLQDAVSLALSQAGELGADAAEAGVSAQQGLTVTVRLGEVETVEHNRDRTLTITVYKGRRKGTANCGDIRDASIREAVAHACAIATHTEADPASGLAEPEQLATIFYELDMWHPCELTPDQLIERALTIEQAGRETDARIRNSDGASIGSSQAMGVYGNTHGFIGAVQGTSYYQSAVLIAAEKSNSEAMQSDYAWDSKRRFESLQSPEATGRKAAERSLRKLGARPIKTMHAPILFNARSARTLLGHMVSAVSGGALYRKSSFLRGYAGQQIFPEFIHISENPHQRCGVNSSSFDSDGVATGLHNELVKDGVLERYILGTYSARRLGMTCTGNGGGVRNLRVQPGQQSFTELIEQMNTGLIVTDVMGHGVDAVTGDYSRGATGFWVENGEIVHPVEEVTIAGNLRDMYANLLAVGNDLDTRKNQQTPSWLLAPMMIAGS